MTAAMIFAAMSTVLQPSPGNPLVAVRLVFRTGSVDDPKGKEGLAALTAAMVGKGGSKAQPYAEAVEALYPLAADIRVRADKEVTVVEGMVHRDNVDAYTKLLLERVLEPRFAEDDFTRNRQDAIDAIAKTLRGNDDENLGKQALARAMYGDAHPYGRPTLGTVKGLEAITLDDVKKFWATHWTRDRLIVGLGGGYPDGFADKLTKELAKLPAKGAAMAKLPAAPKASGVVIVDKPARATAISIGRPIKVTRSDNDFYPLFLAASYLGEHRTFNGVLMNHMRGVRGMNYGDYAYVENFIQQGGSTFPLPNITRRGQHFEIWIRPVPPQNAGFALREAIYETDKLVREGIPQAGFDATKEFLTHYSNLWTQDVSRRLGYAIDAVIYGKDLQGELKTRLPKMTKADVDKAIKKYLSAKDLSVGIVADKGSELAKSLESGEPTPMHYDTKGTPDAILEEDKVIEKFPLSLGKIAVVPADQIFEK
jgi:zinc protease